MDILKKWLSKTGLNNLGVTFAGLFFWWFFPGAFFNYLGFTLIGFSVGLNWQALKDLTNKDEDISEILRRLNSTVNPDKKGEGKDN